MFKLLTYIGSIFLISATKLHGQIPKVNISYGIGSSSALGSFKSASFNTENAGFAGTGISTAFNMDYKFKNGNLGASLSLNSQTNTFKSTDYGNELQRNISGLYDANIYGGIYVRTSYMVGFNYVYPVNDKSMLTFRLMGGATIGKLAEQEGFLYGSSNMWYVQPAVYATSPGFSVGGSFRTPIFKNINLNAECNYASSSYEFTNVANYYSTGNISTFNSKISMSSLQLLLGISVDLI